jgi:hypothetical protein
MGLLEVRVTDAPPEGVTSIVVTVSNIEVHRADASEDQGWLTLFESSTTTESTPRSFDLVELTGIEEVLGTEELPAGKYTQIRMAVDKVVVTHEGREKDAALPGDRLKVVRPFDVEPALATELTLDFDAARSVIITGAGRVHFKPTVKLLIRKEDRGPSDSAPSQGGRPESSGADRPERPDSGVGRPGDAGQAGRPDSGPGRPGDTPQTGKPDAQPGRPGDTGRPSEGQATSTPGQ